jgi:hypothetical protein
MIVFCCESFYSHPIRKKTDAKDNDVPKDEHCIIKAPAFQSFHRSKKARIKNKEKYDRWKEISYSLIIHVKN